MADVNESVRRGKFGQFLRQMGLTEALSSEHPNLPETKSWFRGKHQIEGVWFSPELQAQNSMLLPFGFGVGDHRMIIIDVPTKQLIGTELPAIQRPKARRLQSFHPKVQNKYLAFMEKYEQNHHILSKYQTLHQNKDLPVPYIKFHLEQLDKILSDGMTAAEKRC
jgi:hypothetical protein